jgi:predicted amidohydrolase
MADRIRVACVQLTSGRDKDANLEKAEKLVAQAAATGADIVALPEKWNAIGPPEVLHDTAEAIEDGVSVETMRGWAKTHGITLVGGSITERREGREKLSNTCLVFDPEGELVATYRKIHLFDVEVGGLTYRESEAEEHGEEPVVTEVEGWPVGSWRWRERCWRPSRPISPSTPARTTGTSCCAPAPSRTASTSPRPRRWGRRASDARATAAR